MGDLDPAQLGVDETDVELRLDVRALAERKLAAARAHDCQLDVAPGSFFRRIFAPLLVEEWYIVAHGPPLPPAATDPFAGL